MEMLIYVILAIVIILLLAILIIYRYLISLDAYVTGVSQLLARTFEHYYNSENIKPQGINWGIELIWKPENNDEEQETKKGFIVIYYGEDSGIDTPIEDVVEADILSQKIIEVANKHIQDKEIGVVK